MNKSKSKYFVSAAKMDEAFLKLLEKKDFAYITVKEICEVAGVNRSTFYLHYETMADLLSESVSHMNEQFLDYMKNDAGTFITKIKDCPLDELYLVTPEYLMPYLSYIKEHQRMFRTVLDNAAALGLENSYAGLMQYVLVPIMDRYEVAEKDRTYIMTFYIHGLMAIITEWLQNDCNDSIEHIIAVMQRCVRNH